MANSDSNDCTVCHGIGTSPGYGGPPENCDHCGGSGKEPVPGDDEQY